MIRRESSPKDVMRTAFIALWGVLTLVLVFTVGFLVYQLSQSEDQTVISNLPGVPIATNTSDTAANGKPVRLYFADPVRIRLVAEERALPLTASTVDNCRAAFAALAEGPISSDAVPVMPLTAKVRALYLLRSGELVVDLSREVDSPLTRSASAEWLMIQAIVHTLAQPALQGSDSGGELARPVTTVRLLYEGSPMAEGFPTHIALSEPLRPDRSLLGGE